MGPYHAALTFAKTHSNLTGLFAACLSGCLWFLATADYYIWPLGWIASVPLLLVADRAPTAKRAFLWGWLSGVVMNAGGFYWIVNLLERFGNLPWIVAIALFGLLCAYQGLLVGAYASVFRGIRRRAPDLPAVLVAPVVMVSVELLVPLLFPYYMAITQAPALGLPGVWWPHHIVQVADLAGPLGVTALLFVANGAIYDVLTLPDRRLRLRSAIAAGAILLAALGYGEVRLRQIGARRAAAPKIEVGLVQPNVAFDEKGYEHPEIAAEQLHDLQDRSRDLEQQGADLVVWPESSYPDWIDRRATRDWRLDDLGKRHPGEHLPRRPVRLGVARTGSDVALEPTFSAPLVFGAVTMGPGDKYPHNSAIIEDRDGTFSARFDKIFLLMFGEYIPFKDTFAFVDKIVPKSAGHMARGKEVVAFPFHTPDGREWRLGPMICYEDILPDLGRKLAAKHPHLLVNITNDAWFGDTSEPWEHLALSTYRAIEVRTDLVRSVNTGVSAFIDATGAVQSQTYAVDPEEHPDKDHHGRGLIGEAALMEGGHTVYAAVGDLFGWLCFAATLYLWQVLPRLRRRRGSGA